MKTYNDKEFREEVLKQAGWTEQQLSEYLDRKTKETLAKRLDDDDVRIFVKRLKEYSFSLE